MPMQENGLVVIDGNDIGKTDIEILMDLIFETNKLRIPQEQIFYGVPSALDQRPDIDTDENTFIPVRVNQEYDDTLSRAAGFLYRRVTLNEYFEGLTITITATQFPFTVRSIWDDQVKPHLPFPIDKNNIEDYLFTDLHSATIPVSTVAGSLLWCGTVKLILNPINPAFFELVPVTPYLTGFVEYAG